MAEYQKVSDFEHREEAKKFSKCTVEEILDFKDMVDEIYGTGVIEKTVREDISRVAAMFEAKVKPLPDSLKPVETPNAGVGVEPSPGKQSFRDSLIGDKHTAGAMSVEEKLKFFAIPRREGGM